MASLTGQLVAETYKALLKLIDNDILTASEKQITDGFGGGSNVFIDSQGFLRANKYKVTNGLATQFLKADGSLDTNTYLTSITGAQVITALGYTPVPTTRTITINGETHNLAADNTWTIGGTAAIWGNITGTLSNQTDLQNALNAKYNNPTGTISQYIRGDGTLATFPTLPGGLPTGGTTGQILAKIDATDYNTHWIDNYATQTKNEVKLGQAITKGSAVYVSSANGTNMIVSKASNTSEATSSKTFGLLETGGATNDIVKCVTFGLLAGLDTSAAQAGDPVWLGVNGALIYGLANKPYAPAHLVYIGVVTRVQSNNGEIFVNVQNGFELKEIHDVYIADPANNHGLFYDIADGLWKNKSIISALGYTPQAQLSGTGFVKASGTTITYDNSTYLTTTDAASTYQRLDKMVSNLLPSATEYPNSNAVITALALKADSANPVFTGNMTISGAEPKLYFTDTDQNPDYFIGVDAGYFRVYDQTAGATRFLINSDGNISTGVGKSITAGSFIKDGGTASQFLKADGSIDANTYVASSALADYLLIATAASTYQRLDKMVSNLLPSSTEYPNSNAVINALALKADAANPVFTGNMTISGATPRLYFVDTDQNPDYTVFIDSGYFYIYDQTAGATRFSINSSGNINTGVGKSITAGSFIKESGTSSQFLMADGSVSTGVANTITGSLTSGYIPKATGANAISNSLIYDNGTKVFIGTTTTNSISTGGLTLSNATSSSLVLYNGAVIGFIYGSSVAAGMTVSSEYDLRFETGDGSGSNWPERMRLFRSTGNLSLGYGSSPADTGYKLDVNGTGRFIGDLRNSWLVMRDDALEEYKTATNTAGVAINYVGYNSGTSYFRNFTVYNGKGSQILKITGSTGNTEFLGQVSTGALYPSYLSFYNAAASNKFIKLADDSSEINAIGFSKSGSTATVWFPNGNVGIGTTSPDRLLTVSGTSGTLFSIKSSQVAGYSEMEFTANGTSGAYIFKASAGYGSYAGAGSLNIYNSNAIGFHTASLSNAIYIASGGNVLVGNGTTDAGYKLDVNGTARIQADLSVSGNARVYNTLTFAGGDRKFECAESGCVSFYSNEINSGSQGVAGDLYIGYRRTNRTYIISPLTVNSAATFSNRVQAVNFFSVGSLNSSDGSFFIDHPGIQTWKIGVSNSNTSMFSIGNDYAGVFASKYLNITNAGNVMIGTTSDNGARLRVVGGTIDFAGDTRYGVARIYNASVGDMFGMEQVGSTQTGGGAATRIFTANSNNNFISLGWYTNATAFVDALKIVATGGAATFVSSVTATSFFESSDFRLKKLIESNPIIEGIENLQAKLYEKNGKIELGYFAQDAEKIMPYAVTKNEEGFLNLSYREIHTAKISRLEKEVAELKAQLNLN